MSTIRLKNVIPEVDVIETWNNTNSDNGLFIKRYQTVDGTSDSVVSDTATETGTAQAGTATTITLAAGANASDDYYNGWWLHITGGTGSGQVRRIKDYNGTTKVATIYNNGDATPEGSDFATNPDATSVYSLFSRTYVNSFYDESVNTWKIGYSAETSSAVVTQELANLTVNDFTIVGSFSNGGLTSEGQMIVDHTDPTAFLVRKDGDSGDVFTIDTTNSVVNVLSGTGLTINTSNHTDNALRIGYNSGSQQILFERNGGTATSNILVDSGNALCIRNQDGTNPFIDLVLSDAATNDGRVRVFSGRLQTGANNHNIVPGHGVLIDSLGNTFTDNDTAASGTATVVSFNSFEAPTLAATNATVTTTDAATVYIAGAPSAGTNMTITNEYALWVDSGNVRMDGNLDVTGTVTFGASEFESIIVDGTSTEALLVRKNSDGGDVFIVDTTNTRVGIGKAPSVPLDVEGTTRIKDTLVLYQPTGGGDGGQLVLGFPGADITAENASSWNIDVDDSNNLRFFVGGSNPTLSFASATGKAMFDGCASIDCTDTEAFLVRKNGDTGDIFTVDTTNDRILFGDPTFYNTYDGIDPYIYFDTDDYFFYDRSENQLRFRIGGTTKFLVTSTQVYNEAAVIIDTTSSEALIVRKDSDSGDIFIVDTTNSHVNVISSYLDVSGPISGTPSTTGQYLALSSSTFTDDNTAGSGTATAAVFNSIAAPTLAATNTSVTTTDAATFYIGGAPTAGTNQTITNAMSLWVDSGISRFDSQIQITGAPGSIGNSDITQGHLMIGSSSNGIGIDQNEIYRKGTGTFILGTIDTSTALSLRTDATARINITDSLIANEIDTVIDVTSTEAFLVRKNSDAGDVFTVDTSGDIMTMLGETKLQDGTGFSILSGADVGATTLTNDTQKFTRIGMPHYHNAEEPVSLIIGDSDGTDNIVAIGGGTTLANQATIINFHAAANDATTGSGNVIVSIDNNGLIVDNTNTEALLVRKDGDGGDVFTVDTSANVVTVNSSKLDVSGAISGTPGTTGAYLTLSASTFTDNDTAGSGTATDMVFNSISAPILAATNASVTTTNASTLYIAGSPIAGTNQTITNSYSLLVESGTSLYKGDVNIQNGFLYLGADVSATTLTDDTRKFTRIILPHYDIDEEGVCLLIGDSDGTDNIVNIGGGSTTCNNATKISFYSAADTTTTSGTEVAFIDINGLVIDNTSTEAFLVRKNGDTGDIFTIDTSANVVTTNSSNLRIQGNITGTPSTSGAYLSYISTTFTDSATAGSGTAASMVFNSFATPTLAATNTSVTTTDAATMYIQGAPIAGTNQTITNGYALWVDSGTVRLDGDLIVNGSLVGDSVTYETLIIDSTSTEAFLVRKDGDAGDVFTVDTTNDEVDITAKLTVVGSGSIAGSNLANSHILVGTSSTGIGMDINELYCNGNDFIIGTIGSNYISMRPVGTEVFRISSDTVSSEQKVVIDTTDTEAFLVRKNSDGGDIFTVDTTNEDVKVAARTTINGDYSSGPNITGSWLRVIGGGNTFTDVVTAGSGTAAANNTVGIGQMTLAATNSSVTTTDAASLYIAGAPIAGTNQTITNPYSLWVDAGTAKFDGDVLFGGEAQFRANFNGTDPFIYFDTDDYLNYIRSSNLYRFFVGGNNIFEISANDLTANGNVTIDDTNTEALLVRKDGDGGDVFTVDTTNEITTIKTHLLLDGNQNYLFDTAAGAGIFTNQLSIQSQTAATNSLIGLYTADADGTDDNILSIFAIGGPSASSNYSRFVIGYDQSASSYLLVTDIDGTGTNYPITIETSGNNDQLKLNTDGSVTLSNNIASTGVGTGTLQVTGGAYFGNSVYIDSDTTIDSTATEAFIIRKAGDSGDIFTVDTTNERILISDLNYYIHMNGTNPEILFDSGDLLNYNRSTNTFDFTIGSMTKLTIASSEVITEVNSIIDTTSTEAFLVRKNSDGGDIFTINTTDSEVTVNSSIFTVAGDRSGSSHLFGQYLKTGVNTTFTDSVTAASGTATAMAFNSIRQPTLAATNVSVTTTDVANLYIEGAPIAGTNQTLTNSYSLWVDAGTARFDGQVFTTNTFTSQNGSGMAAVFGADVGALTLTDATRKFARVGFPHYTNAEEDVIAFVGDSDGSDNTLSIGGGTTAGNTCTKLRFMSASNTTTTNGSEVAFLDINGLTIDRTTNEAFLVRKVSDGGDVFTVDTTNSKVFINGEDVTPGTGVIAATTFSAANNQASAANVTGFTFSEASVRSFKALITVVIDATADVYSQTEIRGLQKATGTWVITTNEIGDSSGIVFSITSSGGNGQIQYTSTNQAGFVSSTFTFSTLEVHNT